MRPLLENLLISVKCLKIIKFRHYLVKMKFLIMNFYFYIKNLFFPLWSCIFQKICYYLLKISLLHKISASNALLILRNTDHFRKWMSGIWLLYVVNIFYFIYLLLYIFILADTWWYRVIMWFYKILRYFN